MTNYLTDTHARLTGAVQSFRETLKAIVPMDDTTAQAVAAYYAAHKLVKLCPHTGQAFVKHGALLSQHAVSCAIKLVEKNQ